MDVGSNHWSVWYEMGPKRSDCPLSTWERHSAKSLQVSSHLEKERQRWAASFKERAQAATCGDDHRVMLCYDPFFPEV